MPAMLALLVIVIGFAVLAGLAAILAALILAFAAAPGFWAAFWLAAAALIAISVVSRASSR